jgi:hypothetical protein
MKPQNIQYNLASLAHYHKSGTKKKFEDLPAEERKAYMEDAGMFLIFLDKLNLSLCPKVDEAKEKDAAARKLDTLEKAIQDFVLTLKHPKDVAKFFPAGELAKRLEGI